MSDIINLIKDADKAAQEKYINDVIDKSVSSGEYDNLKSADEYIKQIELTENELEDKLKTYIDTIIKIHKFVTVLKDRYSLEYLRVLTLESVVVGGINISTIFDSHNLVCFGTGRDEYEDKKYIIIDHNGEFDLNGFSNFIKDNPNHFKSLFNILSSDKIYRLILAYVNDIVGYNTREADYGFYVTHLKGLKQVSSNIDHFIQEMNKK